MVRPHRPGGSAIISSRSSQSRPEGKEVHLLIRQSRKESGNFTSTEGGSSLVKPRAEKCFGFSNQHTAKQFRMRTNFSPSLGRGGPLECSIRNTSSYPISRQYGLFFARGASRLLNRYWFRGLLGVTPSKSSTSGARPY
jgi:hypothetical protein